MPTHVGLPRMVIMLAAWPLLEKLMQSMVGIVDTALAGHLPQQAVPAVNAVGAGAFLVWLMALMLGAVGMGSTALIARLIGARRPEEAETALGQSITTALVWGCFTGLFFYFSARELGMLAGLEGRGLALCVKYLHILAWAAPFRAVLIIGSACLRGAGDFRSPALVMVVVNVVNIAASLLLVIAPGWPGGLGVVGIALGTLVAWAVGACLMLVLLIRGRGGIRLHFHRLPVHRGMLWRIVRLGVPNLVGNGGAWFGQFLVLAIVGRLAIPAPVGSHVIAVRIEALSFLPGFALGLAASTLAGQYLGAGDVRMARKAVWVCWGYAAVMMACFGAAFILVPEAFVRLITNESTFLNTVPPLLAVVGWAQVGFASYLVFNRALRGAGDVKAAMLLLFGSTYLVRLPLVYIVAVVLDAGLTAVWIVLSCELMFRGVIFTARMIHGGWTRARV